MGQNNYIFARNNIFAKLLISLFFLVLGLFLLFLSPSYLYGIFLGLGGSWISIFLYQISSSIVRKTTKSLKLKIWFDFFTFMFIRLMIFLLIFLIPIFMINKEFFLIKNGVKLLLEPINIIFIIICYQSLAASIVLGNFIKI